MTPSPCATRRFAFPALARVAEVPIDFPTPEPPPIEPRPIEPRPNVFVRHRRLWVGLLAVAALAVAVVTLRDRLPNINAVGTALRAANPRWIVLAALLEALSMSMFARQQRALLRAMSVRMSLSRALAVTYARSAISISMPAGSAVSAGFAFQQYRRSGASREHATAVMVLSGIVSFLGLAALYTTGTLGLVVVEPETAWRTHSGLIVTIATGVLAVAAIWLVHRYRPRRASTSHESVEPARPVHARLTGLRSTANQALHASRSLRARHWIVAGGFAVVNWLTDLLCLASAARAFGLPVGLVTLAGIYLGVQLVRQIPITPGGIGLIETGLLAGLASAGAPGATAAAVVLTYRLLSCWLVLPIGGLSWLALRRSPRRVPMVTS